MTTTLDPVTFEVRLWRGGLGVERGGRLYSAARTVMSYCCDRERSVTWGLWGGLPSIPHGVWLNKGKDNERYLGSIFSGERIEPSDEFTRPSAGGGGLGDPLLRPIDEVKEDVIDGYVTIDRARKDYGVIIKEIDAEICAYDVDISATEAQRAHIAAERESWLELDAEEVARRYRDDELDEMDAIRQYGTILDWGSGQLLPDTTAQFRKMLRTRMVPFWRSGLPAGARR